MCKYFTYRTMKKIPYCRFNREFNPICSGCLNKAYKEFKSLKANKPLNKITKKRSKAERNRYSIFTTNLDVSIEIQQTKADQSRPKQTIVDLHECIGGRNRSNSIKYGLVVPLTREEHEDNKILLKWKLKAQEKFVELYGYDKFIEIFKTDYINKYKKLI